MDHRISAAVENNARWCDLVCRSHGIYLEAAIKAGFDDLAALRVWVSQ